MPSNTASAAVDTEAQHHSKSAILSLIDLQSLEDETYKSIQRTSDIRQTSADLTIHFRAVPFINTGSAGDSIAEGLCSFLSNSL